MGGALQSRGTEIFSSKTYLTIGNMDSAAIPGSQSIPGKEGD